MPDGTLRGGAISRLLLHHVHDSLNQSIQVDGTDSKQVEAVLVCGCHQVQPLTLKVRLTDNKKNYV